jgi:hypothetical protein
MNFEAWLILINLQINSFCELLIYPEPSCFESIQECVLDGESFNWCTENYTEEN